jgi:hypothetical protein
MRIAGNSQRTIEIYQYIFEQFMTINKLRYVDDINGRIDISLFRCARSKAAMRFVR